MPARLPKSFIVIALLAIAAGARLIAAAGDFWFDEIWSWAIAVKATTPWEILTDLRHDNNHPLNTLALYVSGPDRGAFVYRLPAVLAGIGAVILAGRLAAGSRSRSRIAMGLFAVSYFFIHYTSEARGYAFAVFFALLSWLLLQRSMRLADWHLDVGFNAATVLGCLSHLSFVYAYAAMALWSVRYAWTKPRGLLRLAAWHAVPAGLVVWLYVTRVRDVKVGGGPGSSAIEAMIQALSLAVGGPLHGWLTLACALLALAVVIGGILLLRRDGDDGWLLHALVPVLAAGAAVGFPRDDFYPRFFLVAAAFALLLLARVIDEAWRRGGSLGQVLAAVFCVAFVVGNALHFERLVRVGRASYREALATIAATSHDPQITIGSLHDFRTFTILRFYGDTVQPTAELYYYPRQVWPRELPEWILTHDYGVGGAAAPELPQELRSAYQLMHSYPYAGLSGWNWHLYRATDPPRSMPPQQLRVPTR